MTLGTGQYVQIGAGALVAAAGVWFLARGRFYKKPQPLHIADSGGEPRVSQPTLITIGFVLILIGYHLGIWAVPPALTAVQLNRQFWYIWIVVGVLGLGASVVMDRYERRKSGSSGDTPP